MDADAFKDKTVLMWDLGNGIEHAVRLAKDFKRVMYCTPPSNETSQYFVGRGFEGVQKILYFFDEVDKADLVMCGDVGHGDLAHWLKQNGKLVFGAGHGERCEAHRYPMRQIQRQIGLPTQKTALCKGFDALDKYIDKHPNQVVKFDNVLRDSNGESFVAKNREYADDHLHNLEVHFGPFADEQPVMVEEVIDGIEIGFDGFFYGDWVRPCLWGIEEGSPYLGRYDMRLPPFLETCMTKLTPVLKAVDYRGAISVEMRVINKHKAYLIDMTCRFPYNLSMIFTESIENYSEVIWNVANGMPVELKPKARYVAGATVVVESDDEWSEIEFPPKLREEGKIKFGECACHNGKFYAIKGRKGQVWVQSMGSNIDTIIKEVISNCEKVDAINAKKDRSKALWNIYEDIKKARRMGINF